MSFWVAGATVVGAVASSVSASKSRKDARRARQTEMQWQQEQYDDWKDVYGPIEQNLASYYENVSPEYYEVQGLEAFEAERAQVETQLAESLAQRGIVDSGVAASLELQQGFQAAETRAGIRLAAPAQAAAEKLQFLQVGLGQDPSSGLASTLARGTAQSEVSAQQAEAVAGKAVGQAVTAVGTGLADYNNPSTGVG